MAVTRAEVHMTESLPVEIRYSGKDVEDGSMPLSDVVGALKGFSDAYTQLVIFKKSEVHHTIRINGIKQGSVSFVLEVLQTMGQHKDAMEALGGLGGAAAVITLLLQVIDLTRFSKGKDCTPVAPATSIVGNNNIIIQNCDNVQMEFPLVAYEAYTEGLIKQHLSKMCAPLETGKIDAVAISTNDKEGKKVESVITSKEKGSFEYSSEEIVETKEMVLVGNLVSLNKERNGGSFRLQNGTRISYKLKSDHPEFLYGHILHKGLVKVKCIAHMDENLNPTRIDITDIQDMQPSLFPPKAAEA